MGQATTKENTENQACSAWGRGWAHFIPWLLQVAFVLLLTAVSISALQWSLSGLLCWSLGWTVASAVWWGLCRSQQSSWPLVGYGVLSSLAAGALWWAQPAFFSLALPLWFSGSVMLLWGCNPFPRLRQSGLILVAAHVLVALLAVVLISPQTERFLQPFQVIAWILVLMAHAGLAAVSLHSQTLRARQEIAQLELQCIALQQKSEEKAPPTDPLTGADSLPRITEFINQLRERHARKTETFCVALVEMDPWGPRAQQLSSARSTSLEQQVQMMLGGLLSAQIRSVDRLGRHRAAAFCLVLPDTNSMQAIWVLHRIRASMRYGEWKDIETLGQSSHHHPTLTISVAEYLKGETAEQLLNRADMALQHGRSLGLDQIVIAEDLNF